MITHRQLTTNRRQLDRRLNIHERILTPSGIFTIVLGLFSREPLDWLSLVTKVSQSTWRPWKALPIQGGCRFFFRVGEDRPGSPIVWLTCCPMTGITEIGIAPDERRILRSLENAIGVLPDDASTVAAWASEGAIHVAELTSELRRDWLQSMK